MIRNAVFSECGLYRYVLERDLRDLFDVERRTLMAVLLNPSRAGFEDDDNTTRRMIDYATVWGFNHYYALNLGALVLTDSKKLKSYKGDIVGPDTDVWIRKLSKDADMIIVGWGNAVPLKSRVVEVLKILEPYDLYCFGKNQDGSPTFPLYQKKTLIPTIFRGAIGPSP